jgi:hypothetical protein
LTFIEGEYKSKSKMSEGEVTPSVEGEKTDYQVWSEAVKESFGSLTDEGLKQRDGEFSAAVEGRKGEVEGFIQKLLGGGTDMGGGGKADQEPFDLQKLQEAVFNRLGEENLDDGEKRLFHSVKVAATVLHDITRGEARIYDEIYKNEKYKQDVASFVIDMASAGVASRETMIKNFPELKRMMVDLGMGMALREGTVADKGPQKIAPEQARASGEILVKGRDVSAFTRSEISRFSDKFPGTIGERIKIMIERG